MWSQPSLRMQSPLFSIKQWSTSFRNTKQDTNLLCEECFSHEMKVYLYRRGHNINICYCFVFLYRASGPGRQYYVKFFFYIINNLIIQNYSQHTNVNVVCQKCALLFHTHTCGNFKVIKFMNLVENNKKNKLR